MTDYTLGPLPWDEETLRQAYFQNSLETQKAIQKHPGFPANASLDSLERSLEIFTDSMSELFQSLRAFHNNAESPSFWTRPEQCRFKSHELAIRRGVFTFVTSAMALVDHCRAIKKEMQVDEKENRFLQCLRNYVSHVRIIEIDWQRTYSESGKRTEFLLQRDNLLKWDKWHPQARAFIDEHPPGIEIERFFTNYRMRVELFWGWLYNEIIRISQPQLSEYCRYEGMLKKFGIKSFWTMLLSLVIRERLDPYRYLDRYLTQSEWAEVLALPKQSQVQVDRIIEILDEYGACYGACDEELREQIYKAFGIKNPDT